MIARIAAVYPIQSMYLPSTPRLILAAFLSPLTPPCIVFSTIYASSATQPFGPSDARILIIVFFISYVGFTVCGLPCVLILRRMGWLSLVPLIGAGVLGGTLLFLLFFQLLGLALGSSTTIEITQMIWGAGFGASTALIFSLIAGLPILARGLTPAG